MIWAFVAFLVVYGNVKAAVLDPSPEGSRGGVLAGLALVGLLAGWGRALGLSTAEVGIALDDRRVVVRNLGWGALAGVLCGGAIVITAALGAVPPDRPEVSTEWSALLRRVLVFLPFDTVVPEELAFRGVLLGWLLRAGAPEGRGEKHCRARVGWAVLVAAVPFMLWHLTIAVREMSEFRLGELLVKLGGYYVGGVVFGYLRVATGHLAGSAVAHWLFNGLSMMGVRASLG
jgi:membrane protease YdiL (CAAX protease family)